MFETEIFEPCLVHNLKWKGGGGWGGGMGRGYGIAPLDPQWLRPCQMFRILKL